MARKTKTNSADQPFVEQILTRLRKIEAPLKTEASAEKLSDLLGKLQDAPSRLAFNSLARPASAEIVRVVGATLDKPKLARAHADSLLFAFKLLLMLGTREGADLVIRAANMPLNPNDYMWSVVLDVLTDGHPGAAEIIERLASPLPPKLLGMSLLDAANSLFRAGRAPKRHPFASREGQRRLLGFLRDNRPENSSYAVSVCAAIPFLPKSARGSLLRAAHRHKSDDVRMEATWASARLGERRGVDELVQRCLNVNTSWQAQRYLSELGRDKLIPKPARNREFRATAEMCAWLAHPMEFGEPPDHITLFDHRRIYWPPRRIKHAVWLFKFEYHKTSDRDPFTGVGMVGPLTFAHFDEDLHKLKPEEIYGLYCCRDFDKDDPRRPRRSSPKAGWKLICAGEQSVMHRRNSDQ